MRSILASILASIFASQAWALGAIGSCQGLDSIANLVGNVRTYENGIRAAHVFRSRTGVADAYVLIFVTERTPDEEYPDETCYAVTSDDKGAGFTYVLFEKHQSSEDSNGIHLTIPVLMYDKSSGTAKPAGDVKVRVKRYLNGTSEAVVEN